MSTPKFPSNISTTSWTTGNCLIPDCTSVAIIRILRAAAGDDEGRICTPHYHKLIRRMREEGMSEDDIHLLTNQEVVALVVGGEFQQLIARLVADERFKEIIRERVKGTGEDEQHNSQIERTHKKWKR